MKEVTLEKRCRLRERPEKSVCMQQNWDNLLFLHWKCDKELIEQTLPPGLHVDTFNGDAYIGVIPFYLNDLKFPPLPSLPPFKRLLELNLRTYVYDSEGNPGVWFYSLGLNSHVGAWVARKFYYLPYYFAKFETTKNNYFINFKDSTSTTEFNYNSDGNTFFSSPESLEFFLVERYQLFAAKGNQLYSGRIYHKPYPLSQVTVKNYEHNLFSRNNLYPINKTPDHMLYSPGVNVDFFKYEKLNFN
jgi:uncharacterized protein YqjF (DUF2071 family)